MYRTPWYPSKTKPVRVGVYEVQVKELTNEMFSYWNGKTWGWAEYSLQDAEKYKHNVGGNQEKVWRGLTKEAK